MRRHFVKVTIWVMAVLVVWTFLPMATQAAEEEKKADLLFVQSAKGVTLDNGKLTLTDVSPTTIYFSDRPQRIAGHMTTEELVSLWGEGKDSFLADPPNATLSLLGGDKAVDVVVVLRNPQLKGNEMTYDVRVLQGEVPAKGGPCSLFIDIIGMPLTPLSYAGVARRTTRRMIFWR